MNNYNLRKALEANLFYYTRMYEANPNFILVRDFLISAASQLTRNGQVLISAVDSPHYQGAFQFDDAAKIAGFLSPSAYLFDPSAFPGYEHTMTHQDGNALDNLDEFSTWVFKPA